MKGPGKGILFSCFMSKVFFCVLRRAWRSWFRPSFWIVKMHFLGRPTLAKPQAIEHTGQPEWSLGMADTLGWRGRFLLGTMPV